MTRTAKLPPPDIPQSVEALTPEWLTQALGPKWLGAARVSKVESEPLGEGEGFVGELARLHLSLDGDAPEAPRSLVAKLPTQVAENRALGEMLGAYEREVFFYRELAADVGYRTARVYYAAMDENPASEYGPALIRFVDRLPFFLIRLLMRFFRWAAGKSTRRYLLLIEDLAPAELGDQLEGRAPEHCHAIVRHMARCQAGFWEDPRLSGRHWMTQLDLGLRIGHDIFRGSRSGFEQRFAALLDAEDREALAWLDLHAVELARALHAQAPATLMHGDFRLDNLFFDDRAEPLVVDWQGVGRAPGVHDLAYFLSGTLPPETGAGDELDLLRSYHAALVGAGISGYDFADCLRDYRRCLLLGLHRMVTIDWVDLGEERGADLIRRWVDRVLARIRGLDREALL